MKEYSDFDAAWHTCPWGVKGVPQRQGMDTILHCGDI